MSKAGPSLLRATLFRAADTARRQDPQLAKIYYLQMTERGATHLKACCVVAGHLAERAWTVLNRGTPSVICDNNGNPVTPAEAKKIVADKWTVPEDIANAAAAARQRGRPLRRTLPGRTGEATLPAPDRHAPAPRQSSPPPDPAPPRPPPGQPPAAGRQSGMPNASPPPFPGIAKKDLLPWS